MCKFGKVALLDVWLSNHYKKHMKASYTFGSRGSTTSMDGRDIVLDSAFIHVQNSLVTAKPEMTGSKYMSVMQVEWEFLLIREETACPYTLKMLQEERRARGKRSPVLVFGFSMHLKVLALGTFAPLLLFSELPFHMADDVSLHLANNWTFELRLPTGCTGSDERGVRDKRKVIYKQIREHF